MFKRGVLLLLLVALVAMVSAEAEAKVKYATIESNLKHPVVKSAKQLANGKIEIVLKEKDAADVAADKDDDDSYEIVMKDDEPEGKPTIDPVHDAKKQADQPAANGEIVRKYKHGSVRIVPRKPGKKAKKLAKKALANDVEQKDVTLEKGESAELEFGKHKVKMTVGNDGVVAVETDGQTYRLPKANDIDVDFTVDKDDKIKPAAPKEIKPADPSILKEVKDDMASVTKKFAELAVKVSGESFSKEAAPIIFVCGLVGAIAAIIGVAAVAVGHVRRNAPAEDPNSVLADVTEEADVEAGVQAETDEATEDAPADKSDSLSDSESDSDEDEEGTFANDNSASV